MLFDDLDFSQMEPSAFKLKTKAQSLAYGRYLYEYDDGIHHVWIKTQLLNHHLQFERGFQQELNFYEQSKKNGLERIVLAHAIINNKPNIPELMFGQQSLVLPHAESIFNTSVLTLDITQVSHQILQVLNILEKLHEKDCIHGDLKHEHFIKFDHAIKLLDFEQSFYVQDEISHVLNATPRYMAPELFQGMTKSKASDIYALGIILLEWLSQTRLQAKTYQEWAVLHCQKLEILLPEQFLCFKPLLLMMLRKQKNQRVVDFSTLKSCLIVDVV
ncbi:protein kinase domain-containing protein [Acinetobacter equi]|uniref:Protein kinase domain-containing protein n=1 Tax=Acinetobacter equi TaxID=1324350 RepID=A0A0N9VY40_9GAMM|nr:protein kinase [Acinetobacter equi]ALH96314.1 hypothetical protein AOY20_12635 [Acinetobacter equi]